MNTSEDTFKELERLGFAWDKYCTDGEEYCNGCVQDIVNGFEKNQIFKSIGVLDMPGKQRFLIIVRAIFILERMGYYPITSMLGLFGEVEDDYLDFFDALPLDPDQQCAFIDIFNAYSEGHPFQRSQILMGATGWGKTRVAQHVMWIAKNLWGFEHCIIVSPLILESQWVSVVSDIFDDHTFIRSTSLIGTKKNGIKHDLLERFDCLKGCAEKGLSRAETFGHLPRLIELARSGCLILVDEIQDMKNRSSQRHHALFEIIRSAMLVNGSRTCTLLMSALPIDKEDGWPSLMKNLMLCPKDEIIRYSKTEGWLWRNCALSSLVNQVAKIKPDLAKKFSKSIDLDLSRKMLPSIMRDLWCQTGLREHMTPFVQDPVYMKPDGSVVEVKRVNLFVNVDEKDKALAIEGAKLLEGAIGFNDEGQLEHKSQHAISMIQKGMHMLCDAKIKSLYRLAMKCLTDDKNCKVIISFPYIGGGIEKLYELLSKFYKDTLVLTGEVSASNGDRQRLIAKFQDHSMNSPRVLIMNPSVGGVGINLHDSVESIPNYSKLSKEELAAFPERPRFMLGAYKHDFLQSFQSLGRPYRRGGRSNVTIMVIYIANAVFESLVVNTFLKSQNAMSVFIPGSNRVLQGHYNNVIENFDDTKVEHIRLTNELEQQLK